MGWWGEWGSRLMAQSETQLPWSPLWVLSQGPFLEGRKGQSYFLHLQDKELRCEARSNWL
jgi:hypothetical protein